MSPFFVSFVQPSAWAMNAQWLKRVSSSCLLFVQLQVNSTTEMIKNIKRSPSSSASPGRNETLLCALKLWRHGIPFSVLSVEPISECLKTSDAQPSILVLWTFEIILATNLMIIFCLIQARKSKIVFFLNLVELFRVVQPINFCHLS